MMNSPFMQHMARVSAEREAITSGGGPMSGSAYEMVLAQLYEHTQTLKAIQSVERKVEVKRGMLADYSAYLEGVLAADTGAADQVVTTLMVWHIDAASYDTALQLADYIVRHKLSLPDRFERNVATLLVEEFGEAALKGRMEPGEAGLILAKVAEMTDPLDAHDQARAKLYKAMGYALADRLQDAESDYKTLSLEQAQGAHALLTRALELHAQIGVKKDLERLERRVKELTPPDPST
ncbi:phage terminase small subunit [Limnohabitans sp. WS1]|uniref:phage terminase small subunit n=1 Tax=Limnohabitans sp. WS1 TaxID=1100726 RepID=UPI000D3655CE|nr:phage terminase small subunit [Limnohabitans sp. WS1]PUE20365.1 hypothetical protein B9Z48_05485 [Limnohabitans sp. WS1]